MYHNNNFRLSLSPSVNSNFEIQQKHRNLEIYHPRWFPPEIKTNREAWRQTAQRHKFFFFLRKKLIPMDGHYAESFPKL